MVIKNQWLTVFCCFCLLNNWFFIYNTSLELANFNLWVSSVNQRLKSIIKTEWCAYGFINLIIVSDITTIFQILALSLYKTFYKSNSWRLLNSL